MDKIKWLEESVLSYQARKKLPASAFCGPNRTYPAQDAAHARNCLARASQNKARLGANYSKVVACCRRKLKKFGGTPTEETVPSIRWLKKRKRIEDE